MATDHLESSGRLLVGHRHGPVFLMRTKHGQKGGKLLSFKSHRKDHKCASVSLDARSGRRLCCRGK